MQKTRRFADEIVSYVNSRRAERLPRPTASDFKSRVRRVDNLVMVSLEILGIIGAYNRRRIYRACASYGIVV
ncbi:MAG: hypothetical protein L6V93_05775 [Clostridiales bacterium]|nr:MAG: hypothetical protein L6V93_05775 [Clostridiales bacterium]